MFMSIPSNVPSSQQTALTIATIIIAAVVILKCMLIYLKGRNNTGLNLLLQFQGKKRPPVGHVIGKVREINVFPGKSMAACPLRKCSVTCAGLKGDRLLMVVKVTKFSKVVATQRNLPQLSQISAIWNEHNGSKVTLSLIQNDPTNSRSTTYAESSSSASLLPLPPLVLDLTKLIKKQDNDSNCTGNKNSTVVIDLHSIKAHCVDLGDEAAVWIQKAISAVLSASSKSTTESSNSCNYRIFALAPKELRRVYRSPARLLMEDARIYDATRLADLAPITFTSDASLTALNQVIQSSYDNKNNNQQRNEDIPMNRFRSNIVMTPATDSEELAFLEDHIQTIQIGSNLILRSIGPTMRCVIPTINQDTGEAGFQKNIKIAEPIVTLKRLRSGGLRYGLSGLLPVKSGGSKSLAPLFGVYLGTEHPDSSGEVSVGDLIRVLEYKRQ